MSGQKRFSESPGDTQEEGPQFPTVATHLHFFMHGQWSATPSKITGLPGTRKCFLKCCRVGHRSLGTARSNATSGAELESHLSFCLESKQSKMAAVSGVCLTVSGVCLTGRMS